MHELGRCGELRGTSEQLARTARCTPPELVTALADLTANGAAEVHQREGVHFIRNRRMYRESVKRKSNAERQMRHREVCRNAECNGEVAFEDDIDTDLYFESFWREFPKGRKGSKGKAREAFEKSIRKAEPSVIIAAAKEYAASEVGQGQFVKMPSTWLNQECWDDDRESWRELKPKHKPLSQRGK